jgi:hypothetical protein
MQCGHGAIVLHVLLAFFGIQAVSVSVLRETEQRRSSDEVSAVKRVSHQLRVTGQAFNEPSSEHNEPESKQEEHSGHAKEEHSGHAKEEHSGHAGKTGHSEHAEHSDHSHASGHKPDSHATAYGQCLLGSVAFVMSLFYLVKHDDEDIKFYTWQTLNVAISIFCAVVIYGIIRTLLFDIVPTTYVSEHAWTLLLWLVLSISLQITLHSLRHVHQGKDMHPVGILFAHVVGFAAMYGFAGYMTEWPFVTHPGLAFVVVCIAIVTLLGLYLGMSWLRQKVQKEEEAQAEQDGKELDDDWMEEVEEAENDAISLCVGFLLMQVTRFVITGKLQPFEPLEAPDDITQVQTNQLFGCSLLFVTVAALWTYALIGGNSHPGLAPKMSPLIRRLAYLFQNICMMTASYCFLYWGEWQVYMLGFAGVRIAGCMVVALILTFFSIVMIFILDFIQDNFMTQTSKKSGRQVFHSIILSISVLVGVAWEKAFDLGLEGTHHDHQHEYGKKNVLITQHILPVLLVVVVLPAWWKYILPMSEKLRREGEELHGTPR